MPDSASSEGRAIRQEKILSNFSFQLRWNRIPDTEWTQRYCPYIKISDSFLYISEVYVIPRVCHFCLSKWQTRVLPQKLLSFTDMYCNTQGIRHTVSYMKGQMRESRTSASVKGVPCERYVY